MTRSIQINKAALFRDLGYEPHPGQLELHRSLAPRRILASGVRSGKTKCATMEGLGAALEPRPHSMGWVVAPTYDLCDRVWRELAVLAAEHLRHRIIVLKEHERRLVLRNLGGGLSEIRGKTADNPKSLLGEGLDWVIVDEAARMKPMIWESHLSQRLVDKRGWALMISTPKGKGWFYDLFRRGQGGDPDYESWNFPSTMNPHLDAEVIEAERDRLPERVFAQEYLGCFTEGSGSVFRNVRECATGEWQEPVPWTITKNRRKVRTTYYAGLDLAKVEDFTVLVIMDSQRRVVYADRFHRIDWEMQVTRIKAATDRYNRAQVLTDVTGVGDPVYEQLRRAGVHASPYPFTAKSKAALVNNLALLLEKKEIVLPRPDLFEELVEEAESFQYSVTDQGNTRTSAPSGQHDDCVVSLALACWHLRPGRPRPRVIVGPPIGRMF